MLKKSVVMAGLVLGLMANAAWADEHGATSGTGISFDRAQACSSAKSEADRRSKMEGGYVSTVTGHSSCDCSSDKGAGSAMWTCTVDAYWEKK
jgi:hypothetical protein